MAEKSDGENMARSPPLDSREKLFVFSGGAGLEVPKSLSHGRVFRSEI
jgi:hypothetical protein